MPDGARRDAHDDLDAIRQEVESRVIKDYYVREDDDLFGMYMDEVARRERIHDANAAVAEQAAVDADEVRAAKILRILKDEDDGRETDNTPRPQPY
jgi:hypothetical protein